jgi:hypothetical protein
MFLIFSTIGFLLQVMGYFSCLVMNVHMILVITRRIFQLFKDTIVVLLLTMCNLPVKVGVVSKSRSYWCWWDIYLHPSALTKFVEVQNYLEFAQSQFIHVHRHFSRWKIINMWIFLKTKSLDVLFAIMESLVRKSLPCALNVIVYY